MYRTAYDRLCVAVALPGQEDRRQTSPAGQCRQGGLHKRAAVLLQQGSTGLSAEGVSVDLLFRAYRFVAFLFEARRRDRPQNATKEQRSATANPVLERPREGDRGPLAGIDATARSRGECTFFSPFDLFSSQHNEKSKLLESFISQDASVEHEGK